MALFWMSFADGSKPKGETFLGVVILEAPTLVEAHRQSWALELNPGGEMMSQEIPISEKEKYEPYMNRLLKADDLKDIGVHTSGAAWREALGRTA